MSRLLQYLTIAIALITGISLLAFTGRLSDLTHAVAMTTIHLGFILLAVVMRPGFLATLLLLGAAGAISILALAAMHQAAEAVAINRQARENLR